jgi:hypothetical protein
MFNGSPWTQALGLCDGTQPLHDLSNPRTVLTCSECKVRKSTPLELMNFSPFIQFLDYNPILHFVAACVFIYYICEPCYDWNAMGTVERWKFERTT